MDAAKFFREMYHFIWQSHDIGKFDEYYAKDFEETIQLANEEKQPLEIGMNYDELKKQAAWQKEHYKDTTIEIKKLVAGEGNHISVNFYSTSIERKSGQLRHRCVCGIWHLNEENKIDRVWAVVTPHYPS